ncbi:lipopolysaccharide core biosynthesis glycosyl transferase [Gluconacetobacter johannae DSM 13595]|uniref:Glycosyltransferase n=1 Tax=Gluconacetobacter johannae TaxID=112140 RepID=A0A7W4P319_9PROT|nr:glycosyltransferase [Gluconacetobacter johannae]MBB2175409.1 glycosyltransferase [Gluconacetobacter johannae]GBQ88769.1 lipopolysaccharide core biosynthesis glycosyl transferase [Gluconacetobacter johannae DSM 13595]
MRILHCICTEGFAGTERHVAELAAWQATEHEVAVLVAGRSRDRRTGGDIVPHLRPPVMTVRASPLGYGVALAGMMRRFRPDIVHTHLGRASVRARLLARGRAPLVATLHTRFSPRAYGRHDGLLCIAQWQREEIPAVFSGQVGVVGNWTLPGAVGVDRARLRAALGLGAQDFVFGTAARMVPEKNLDVLIRAFAQAALPGTRLVLFGDGPERARLEALAGPGVIFAGYRPDLKGDLHLLDGFVLPSRREPFGLVLLEAMEAGLPVLATAAGGVPDILGAESPDLVPPDDVAAMARGLARLRGQSPCRWDMARFRLDRQGPAVTSFYAACLGAGTGG